MTTCKSCKIRFEPYINVNDNVYNLELLDTPALSYCMDCYLKYEKIRELEEKIKLKEEKIKKSRKLIRVDTSILRILKSDLYDLTHPWEI